MNGMNYNDCNEYLDFKTPSLWADAYSVACDHFLSNWSLKIYISYLCMFHYAESASYVTYMLLINKKTIYYVYKYCTYSTHDLYVLIGIISDNIVNKISLES